MLQVPLLLEPAEIQGEAAVFLGGNLTSVFELDFGINLDIHVAVLSEYQTLLRTRARAFFCSCLCLPLNLTLLAFACVWLIGWFRRRGRGSSWNGRLCNTRARVISPCNRGSSVNDAEPSIPSRLYYYSRM